MEETTKTAPEEYDSICPITLRAFRDPVKAPDGHTYERKAIERWITEHGTSPLSRQPLNVKDLVPDDHVRDRVDRRASSTASDTYEEPVFYRSSRVTPINDKNLTAEGENGHVPRKGRYCRQRCCTAITILLAVILLAIGLTVGILLRRSWEHVISKHSSKLTRISPTYCRTASCEKENFFYEAIIVTVATSGKYHITSKSRIDTYGYIYNNSFNGLDPRKNLLAENNDGCEKKQFKLKVDLQRGRRYILVTTTNLPGVTGDFSIIVSGPTSVKFSPGTTIETTTTSGISSSYSLELSTNSPTYCGLKKTCKPKFYYKRIQVNVSTNGSYRFMISKSTKKDVYIYVYNNSFNASNPEKNLISKSDDSSEEKSHLSLLSGNTYILVVTTAKPKKKTFVITAKGAGLVTFSESQ